MTTTPGKEIEAVKARRSQLGAEVERRVSSIAADRTVNRDDPRARGTAT